MVKLYTTCKFCDQRVYFDAMEGATAAQVTYLFKVAMEAHLRVHVDEMVDCAYA